MSWDYHIHSQYCRHADGVLEEYVIAAISKGMDEIGFSEHIPYNYLPESVPREEYGMPEEELQQYFDEIYDLQLKYADQILIKIGMEIDYFPWNQNSVQSFINSVTNQLDYIIGSVHMVESEGYGIWPIDDIRRPYYKYDVVGVDATYDAYFENIKELIQTRQYDILGHFDLVKKFGFRYSDPDAYFLKISQILDIAKDTGICIELNTAGYRKEVNEYYPENTILEMIIERNIPMIINSDAHKPEEVGFHNSEAKLLLKELGLKKLSKFSKHNIIQVDF